MPGEAFDIHYSDNTTPRKVGRSTIRNKLVASEMGREFYDGARENGYGGYRYDGRWKRLWPKLIQRYGLTVQSSVLDVGCKKGFALVDLRELLPGITVRGIELTHYPLDCAPSEVRQFLSRGSYASLPFGAGSFDFVLAWASIYVQNLAGVVETLREIQRVSNGRAYVSVGAYETAEDRELFSRWSLLGCTVLHVDEWPEVFAYAGYTGDWHFTTAKSLNLIA